MFRLGILVVCSSFLVFIIRKLVLWRRNLQTAKKSGFVVHKSPYDNLHIKCFWPDHESDAIAAYIPLISGGWRSIRSSYHG